MPKPTILFLICLLIAFSTAHAQSLIDSTQQLNEVSIVKKKQLVERKNDKTILNIASSSLATGNTAFEILSRAPGVTISQEGNISLRGKSGVSVLINGKLTYLSAEQLKNFLRNTNASAIETIELIHNPSTKYDAAGSGGIINIKLKKNENYGTNVNVLVAGGYGAHYKSNGGIDFNHRNQKLNVFGNVDYSNNKNFEDLNLTRSNQLGSERTYFNQFGSDIYHRENKSYKVGVAYELNAKNGLELLLNGYDQHASTRTANTTLIGNDSSIKAANTGMSKYRNQTYSLNYKLAIDSVDHELTVSTDYATFLNTNNSNYVNNFYDHTGAIFKPPYIFRNATPTHIKIWSGKADYMHAFNEQTKLETGIKRSYVSTSNSLIQENLLNNVWVNDETNSNNFNYKEVINAAYVNLQHKFKELTLQVGLRAELTHSKDGEIKRNYIDFFPNINLSKVVNEVHGFGLSYSKRIDRPDYEALNPFVYFADIYTYSQGNPYLNPQYTNALDFTYHYQDQWNVSLGYSHTKDVITTTLMSDPVKKTLFILEQNLASQRNYNLNIGAPVSITKWWESDNEVTLYYTKFKSPNLMGVPFSSGKMSFIINNTQTFRINKSLNAEASFDYHSAQVYGTYAVKPLYGIDLGLSKSFSDNRTVLKLAVNDVFNQRVAKVSSAITSQDYRLYQKEESRMFRLSFSYNFGRNTIKAAKERSKSSDDEQSRVKRGN
jgi:hypothetical protein